MDLSTQLGGVYRPDNHALFTVKERLQALGVRVTHPIGHTFVHSNGAVYSFDPNVWSAHEVALDYYRSIATCDFHIVCNPKGYIGGDTARAMVYALLKNKPIILLHAAQFAPTVTSFDKRILQSNIDAFQVRNIMHDDEITLRHFLHTTSQLLPQYDISPSDTKHIQKDVQLYLQ